MDFSRALPPVIEALEREGVHYALIGGLALGLWGVARTTADVDLLVLREDLATVDRLLADAGYQRHHQSENVSQYVAGDPALGAFDLLHAFREASRGMLERAERREALDGALSLPVLRPEDLIGLKVQAIANNPGRRYHDAADIEALLRAFQGRLDLAAVKEYFELFELSDLYRELVARVQT